MVQKRRYDNIDFLKTFAIFCVVFIHSFGIKMNFWESGSVSNYIIYFLRTILSVSVPIFFICNGFLLFGKELDLKKHIFKTIKYVCLTYVWALITIMLTLLVKGVRLSVGEIINMIREWEAGWVNHLWFMGALTRVYIIFPILKLAVERKKECLLYALPVLFFFVTLNRGLTIITTIERDNAWLKSFEIFDPFKDKLDWVYFYFCLGGVFYFYQDRIKEWFVKYRRKCNLACLAIVLVNCVLVFVCGICVSNLLNLHWDVVWEGYNMPFTMLSAICVFLLSLNYEEKEGNVLAKLIRTVSVNTLGIYFVHMVIVNFWDARLSDYLPLDNPVIILMCTIIALGLSTCITVMLKKIRGISWLVK